MHNNLYNFEDVCAKYRRKNKILFNHDSSCIDELSALIKQSTHKSVVLWAFHFIKVIKDEIALTFYDSRIDDAISICTKWREGEVKMPKAKAAILTLHSITKEIDDRILAAKIHAIGQGLGTIHTSAHALGLVFYHLTAIVFKQGIDDFKDAVSRQIFDYVLMLKQYQQSQEDKLEKWASFFT